MMNWDKYEYFKRKAKESTIVQEDVRRLSEDYASIVIEYYTKRKQEELRKELQQGKRLRSVLDKIVNKDVSYYIGSFTMIIKIFELLNRLNTKQETFQKSMTALYNKSGVSDILIYLYKHPDSQHKIICERTVHNKSYLSQLLRELEEVGCVERYATGKRSFFSLSIDGQAFVKEKQRRNRTIVSDIYGGKYDLYMKEESPIRWLELKRSTLHNDIIDRKTERINVKEVDCVGRY